MRRAVPIFIALAVLLPRAHADKAPPPPTELSGVLDQLRQGNKEQRLGAAKKLAALATTRAGAIDALERVLQRSRTSSDAERRKALRSIHAEVPDHRGRFRTPGRTRKNTRIAQDKFDWMAKLVELPASTAGLADVIVDVAVIRALAASKRPRAAAMLLDLGFDKEGMVYRDECGRYLRRMSPYSLPALIENAENRRDYWRRRYAIYQLERLDRQLADKALNATTGDTRLMIDLLESFGKVRYRDAVRVVWPVVNHHVPAVRKAARAAWMKYVSGPPPRPAPKKKLQKTGGETTKKKEKLWLNSRELARVQLERSWQEQFNQKAPRGDSEEELTQKLLAHFDAREAKAAEIAFLDAQKKVRDGDPGAAVALFDRLLASNIEHPRRAEMAPAYRAHGRALARRGKWKDAASAFRKSAALAPGGRSTESLAWYHYTLGRLFESQGKDAKPLYRKALEVKPGFDQAEAALAGKAATIDDGDGEPAQRRRPWLLYAGIGGGSLALLLLGLGLFLRRR